MRRDKFVNTRVMGREMRVFLWFLTVALVVGGCRTPGETTNFDVDSFRNRLSQLQPGMPYEQVMETLGLPADPSEKSRGTTGEWVSEYDLSPRYTVTLCFVVGAVPGEMVFQEARLQERPAAVVEKPSLASKLAD